MPHTLPSQLLMPRKKYPPANVGSIVGKKQFLHRSFKGCSQLRFPVSCLCRGHTGRGLNRKDIYLFAQFLLFLYLLPLCPILIVVVAESPCIYTGVIHKIICVKKPRMVENLKIGRQQATNPSHD